MSEQKVVITTSSNVPGFSGVFGTYDLDRVDSIPNVVARACAKEAVKSGGSHSYGMWTARIVDVEELT